MSKPTVSVVMPAYNAAATIDAALGSIRDQERLPDEIVVVDDASSDDTAERAEAWRTELPVVVLRNEVNEGCGATRARAVAAASGDVIAPLDADDVWLGDHLATLLPLTGEPGTIVAVRSRLWQPELGLDRPARIYQALPPPDQQAAAILRSNFLFSGSVAWRETIRSIGGGSTARRADDWEVWIRAIIEAGARAVLAPRPTVLYRIHLGSLSVLDGCLGDEIDLCRRLRTLPPYQRYAGVLDASIRRRQARRRFLDAAYAAERGERGARRAFVDAIRVDPTLAGGVRSGAVGSVALRAVLGVASPAMLTWIRRRRLQRRSLLVPQPVRAELRPVS